VHPYTEQMHTKFMLNWVGSTVAQLAESFTEDLSSTYYVPRNSSSSGDTAMMKRETPFLCEVDSSMVRGRKSTRKLISDIFQVIQ
jgi:hypothetical protein